ncbi:MAG TPA: hypothetical protein VJO32_09255 [Ktedonobacteraceae bacterium]|nr:hypothetical protein [Ktedonobacteraceae bacterium]
MAQRGTGRTSPPMQAYHARGSWIAKIQHLPERTLRRTGAWLLLCFLLQGELGLAWDIRWHLLLGRNSFWIPPHMMIYSAVGAVGLVALAMVLIETLRYHHGFPGVNDRSTVRILRVFHAPLGYIVTGFGPLIALIAVPFDNWWHQLFGIDAVLWSPFHLMGAAGGLLGVIGIGYIFASEAAIERQYSQGNRTTRQFLRLTALEWSVLAIISSLMELTMLALTQFTPLTIGPLQVLTYPLPLALSGAFCLVSTVCFVRKPFAATMTALLLSIHTGVVETFVPWATRLAVAQMGLSYSPGRVPAMNSMNLLLSLLFVLTALVIDSFTHKQTLSTATKRGMLLIGIGVAILAITVPMGIALILAHTTILTPDIAAGLESHLLDLLFLLPVVISVATVGAIWGKNMGNSWHWNKR